MKDLLTSYLFLSSSVTLFFLDYCYIVKFVSNALLVVIFFRLGSNKGEKSRSGMKGKPLRLKGKGRRKRRLGSEQHVKLQRKKLH